MGNTGAKSDWYITGTWLFVTTYLSRWLACGCVGKDSYPILVYSIPDGNHHHTLTGHYNILYDLKWYKQALLSASSGLLF